MRRVRLIGCASAAFVVLLPAFAVGHSERHIESPVRPGPVPEITRVNPKRLVVCKPSSKPTAAQLEVIEQRIATETGNDLAEAQAEKAVWERNDALFQECCFQHIQDAVNAAGDDTDILVMPGVYREEPSRAAPTSTRGDLPNGTYSYEYHVAHPNDASLIAILGKRNITLEGTGISPRDVIIDAGFVKDVGIRCDRCQGFIARNFWEKDANEHGVYTVDSDGYVYDRVVGSFNKEYELFAFASDNGLMTDTEAYGGGDSGYYIGGAPVTPGRYSQTIQRSKMYHNALGFSGTQGNSVRITECDVYNNAIGISFDSENDHPNFPQAYAVIENNDIHDNNFDIYAPSSDVPARGPAYDFFRYPVGTGLWIIGGTHNIIRNNRIYNNQRFGTLLAGNPLESPLPAEIHFNEFSGNLMGTDAGSGAGPNSTLFPPGGDYHAGGSDFFWDGTGMGNCWQVSSHDKTDPNSMPTCPNTAAPGQLPIPKLQLLLNCSLVAVPGSSPREYVTADTSYACPFGHANLGPYENADEEECGNGLIDSGEDCDPGEDETPANLNGESCNSLGHGDGQLACNRFCQWDFSACDAPNACHGYRVARTAMGSASGGPGDDRFRLVARNAVGANFDPTSEPVVVVLRNRTNVPPLTATIPAGAPGWSSPAPRRYLFRDRTGAYGGITRIRMWTSSNFADGFGADIRFDAGVDLSAMAGADLANTVLRIGNDCWEQEAPCIAGSNGSVRCKFPEAACPAPPTL